MLHQDPKQLHDQLVYSLKRFFEMNGKKKALLGLSGGIDSAVVASLAVSALGNENVHGIMMPSPYTTICSLTDSSDLAGNLGISYAVTPIDTILQRFIVELRELIGEEPKRLVIENLQARIRGVLLMAWSNQTGSLLLNTSNKSEIAVGYGTLYGDLTGAIMVMADLYKLQVYEIANYINRDSEIIPLSIINKEPSAELSIDQKDSDTLPQYSLLDPILYKILERGKTFEGLIEEGDDPEVIERVKLLIEGSRFKTHQMPPMIRLGDYPLLPENKCIYFKFEQ